MEHNRGYGPERDEGRIWPLPCGVAGPEVSYAARVHANRGDVGTWVGMATPSSGGASGGGGGADWSLQEGTQIADLPRGGLSKLREACLMRDLALGTGVTGQGCARAPESGRGERAAHDPAAITAAQQISRRLWSAVRSQRGDPQAGRDTGS